MTLKTICAWCRRVIQDGALSPDGRVSHGVCAECRAALESELSS